MEWGCVMVHERYVGQAREPRRRREQCVYCNRLWYVPLNKELPGRGYTCPKCAAKQRFERFGR